MLGCDVEPQRQGTLLCLVPGHVTHHAGPTRIALALQRSVTFPSCSGALQSPQTCLLKAVLGCQLPLLSKQALLQVLASATDQGLLRLHYHTGSLMGELPNEGSAEQTMAAVACIAFSRGSKMLAAGCSDAQQHVWDLKLQVLSSLGPGTALHLA